MVIVIIAVVLSDAFFSGIIHVRMGTGIFLGATPAFTMCFFFFLISSTLEAGEGGRKGGLRALKLTCLLFFTRLE